MGASAWAEATGVKVVVPILAGLAMLAGGASVASDAAAATGQFNTACRYSHTLLDDPIVFPGGRGMSHSHDFGGARGADAMATLPSLLADPTTCARTDDHSAYWVPTLFQRGTRVHARTFRVYYRGGPFPPRAVRPFPPGLRIIAGDARASDGEWPQPTSIAAWACTRPGDGAENDEVEVADVPATCDGLPLRARIVFPQCWDGESLDSPDHKSHMAYPSSRICPATHPVVVPQLTLSIRYWIPDTQGLELSSGGTRSLHADFMPAWSGSSLDDLVARCVNAAVDCGATGPNGAASAPRPETGLSPADPGAVAVPRPPAGRPAGLAPTHAPATHRPARPEPEPAPAPARDERVRPAPATPSADRRPPAVALRAAARQRVRALSVTVGCDETCAVGASVTTASSRGARPVRLATGSVRLGAGADRRLPLRLGAGARRAVARIHGPARVTVMVTARDAAGNNARRRARVTLI